MLFSDREVCIEKRTVSEVLRIRPEEKETRTTEKLKKNHLLFSELNCNWHGILYLIRFAKAAFVRTNLSFNILLQQFKSLICSLLFIIQVIIHDIPFVTVSLLLLLLLFQPSPATTTPSAKKAATSPLSHGVSSLQSMPQTSPVPSNMYTSPDNQALSSTMPHTSTTSNWTVRWSMYLCATRHGAMPPSVFVPETISSCSDSSCPTNTSWQTSSG